MHTSRPSASSFQGYATRDCSRRAHRTPFLAYAVAIVILSGCHNESRLIHNGDVKLTSLAWANIDARMVPTGNTSQVCMRLPTDYTDAGGSGDHITVASTTPSTPVTITGRWIRDDGVAVPPAGWTRSARDTAEAPDDICLRMRSGDSDHVYTSIQLRASAPLTVSRIRWESFDLIGAL